MAFPLKVAPGQTLEGRFFLLEEIGRGGMSTVFKATDLANDGRLVAVKVPLPQFSSGLGSWSMFQREAEIGGKLDHPTSLVFFSDLGTQIMNTPSRDGNALAASIDQNQNSLRTIRRSQGFYGAEDRFQLSLKMLSSLAVAEAAKPGRKIVIWISPGWPMLSGPRIQLSRNDLNQLFKMIVGMSGQLRQAGITLYSLDPLGLADSGGLRTTYYEEFLKGVTGPNRVDMGNLALQVIATQSGGLVTYGSNSIVAGIDRSIADLNAYYVLSMQAAPADKADEYHGLEVKIATPGLTARTRTGYYAQP